MGVRLPDSLTSKVDGLCSIFPMLSLDRSIIRWEEYTNVLTPVQRIGDLRFKREDAFAPLGCGSINGSKARQCLFLVHRMYEQGCEGIATGASVLSPQHCITAAMGAHYDIPTLHVVGATNPKASSKHPSVAIAKLLGAKFDYIGSAYNSSLQPRVDSWVNEGRQHGHYWDKVEYGITVDHPKASPTLVAAFHTVGAKQVANLQEDMETLIIPAGSCNTFVSIMFGLAAKNKSAFGAAYPNLKRIIAVGIGPSRLQWAQERLSIISSVVKYDAQEYMWHPGFEYIDTHKAGIYKYSDRVNLTYEGVKLHPTYEAKVFEWMMNNRPHDLFHGKTVFWIVGGEPSLDATRRAMGVIQ